jgi:hypothetical protein
MKLKEFRQQTKYLPGDTEIIVFKENPDDATCSPLSSMDNCHHYSEVDKCCGNIYNENDSAKDHDMEENDIEWKTLKSSPLVLVLYPMN